jgi:hypothetical protein
LLQVERIGGIAGIGAPGAHIRSRGEIAFDSLSEVDQQFVRALFTTRGESQPSLTRDGFSYRISRSSESGTETIEVPEEMVPAAVVACVKDELI